MSFAVSEALGEDRTFKDIFTHTQNNGEKLHILGGAQSPPHKNLIVS
ncbi:hypothetical protein QUB63_01720 [Microcoleus sp. ARI1-B5]